MSHRPNLLLFACAKYFGYVPGLAVGLALLLGLVSEANSFSTRRITSQHHVFTLNHSSPVSLIAQAGDTERRLPILKLGSRGEQVEELQALLSNLGYYSGTVDGIFGEGTKAAVIEFQQAADLPVDGQVGVRTWESLQQAEPQLNVAVSTLLGSESDADASLDESESEGAASEGEPAAEPEANSETAAETASSNRDWLWWSISLLVALGVVGGVFYSLRRFGAPEQPVPSRARTSVGQGDRLAAPDHQESDRNGQTEYLPITSESRIQTSNQAISETTRLPKVDIQQELIRDLHNPDPVKRRKAIWELGQRGNSDAIQPLVDLMMDSDSSQRSLILASVSEIGIRTLKPLNRALLISLQDESSDVRKNAIRDLTRVYDMVTQVSQLLRHAVEDSDEEVQETARWALGQLNRIRAVSELDSISNLIESNKSDLPTEQHLPSSNHASEHLPGDRSES